MTDIDAEVLITLVEARPELWDKFLDTYKDRNATKDAWHEVCIEMHPDFGALNAIDKNAFGKEVIRRWTNLRDSFSKSKKRIKASKTSGSKAIKLKKYVYFDQLTFLNKIFDSRETVDSMQQNKQQENEGDESMEQQLQASNDVSGVPTQLPPKSTPLSKARKHQKPDEIELRILKAVEGEKPCFKMDFFGDGEFLQFQMGVLKVIADINEKQRAMHPPPLNLSHQIPNYLQRHFIHPSSTTQCQPQQFFTTGQPHLYHEQYMHVPTPSTYAQMPSPNQSQRSAIGNNQAVLLQEISPNSSAQSKQASPGSHYFSEFTSPENDENSLSVTSMSSPIAESVDFSTG